MEDSPFFFYVAEEVPAFFEAMVYLADAVVDYAYRGFDLFMLQN